MNANTHFTTSRASQYRTYIQRDKPVQEPGDLAKSTHARPALRTEAMPDLFGGEHVALETVFAGVPGYVAVLWVDEEVAIALAD